MLVGPGVSNNQCQDDPEGDGQVVGEVHVGPEAAFLAGFLDDAEDVHEEGDDQGDPRQDGAVGAIVEGWVDGEHGCVGAGVLAMT